METRPAAVAGQFYPLDPDELRAQVAGLLAAAEPALAPPSPGPAPPAQPGTPSVQQPAPPSRGPMSPAHPKAIVAPHAGYQYSGPVAASAYRTLRPGRGRIARVVLLGPAHWVPLRGMAGSPAGRWATPLGPMGIDTDTRDALVERGLIVLDRAAHAEEHSLEVQLPFIATVLGEVALLPILVGPVPAGLVADLLERVWAGPETAVVVSTDLSHYHDQATARRLDAETAAAVCDRDPTRLGSDRACGVYALRGLVEAARRQSLPVRLLDLRTSADTWGDPARVVGYGAFAAG